MQRVATGVRSIALGHPRVFPLVATRNPSAPVLRPPLRSLELVEAFLVLFLVAGVIVVGAGGGLTKPMQHGWERHLSTAEAQMAKAKAQATGSSSSSGATATRARSDPESARTTY